MATHSSIRTWRIPWTEESGWLQFMVLQESNTVAHTGTHSGVLFTWVNALCGRARPYNTYMLNFFLKFIFIF